MITYTPFQADMVSKDSLTNGAGQLRRFMPWLMYVYYGQIQLTEWMTHFSTLYEFMVVTYAQEIVLKLNSS